jgi:hypothetical protein
MNVVMAVQGFPGKISPQPYAVLTTVRIRAKWFGQSPYPVCALAKGCGQNQLLGDRRI